MDNSKRERKKLDQTDLRARRDCFLTPDQNCLPDLFLGSCPDPTAGHCTNWHLEAGLVRVAVTRKRVAYSSSRFPPKLFAYGRRVTGVRHRHRRYFHRVANQIASVGEGLNPLAYMVERAPVPIMGRCFWIGLALALLSSPFGLFHPARLGAARRSHLGRCPKV